jgi:hypothetical protein
LAGGVDHAEARQHLLGPEAQRGRLAGMELAARLAHHLQVVHRRTGLTQQRERLGLGIESVEGLRLAAGPAARGALAGQHHGKAQAFVAAAIIGAQIAAADLEQAHGGCAAIEVAAHGRQQAGQKRRRMAFRSSEIGLASGPHEPPIGKVFGRAVGRNDHVTAS